MVKIYNYARRRFTRTRKNNGIYARSKHSAGSNEFLLVLLLIFLCTGMDFGGNRKDTPELSKNLRPIQ